MKLLYFLSAIFIVYADNIDIKDDSVGRSLNEFSLKLLSELNSRFNNENIVISPYTVWTALSIVNDGARGNTSLELERALSIPLKHDENKEFRVLLHNVVENIARKRDGVELDVANALYVTKETPLKSAYQYFVRTVYQADVESLDFQNTTYVAEHINKKISDATRGHISKIVEAGDLIDIEMYITSALFFKGAWKNKFEKLHTRKKPFYNEEHSFVADVFMMIDLAPFAYGSILSGIATAVELPYKDDEVSMIIILPNEKISLTNVLQKVTETSFTDIVKSLKNTSLIDLNIPKFNISSNIKLTDVLKSMGIREIFTEKANLKGISPKSLYVSKVAHRAIIEVDEEGSVAAAATTIEIIDRGGTIPTSPPILFKADRPFVFAILDKKVQSILLIGKVVNPSAV